MTVSELNAATAELMAEGLADSEIKVRVEIDPAVGLPIVGIDVQADRVSLTLQ